MAAKSSGSSPAKRRTDDEAFRAQAPRLASESRRPQAAAQQLGISSKLLNAIVGNKRRSWPK